MRKKLLPLILAAAFIATAQAAEPYIKKTEKEVVRDGKKYSLVDQSIFFENGKIWYVTLSENGKKELVKQKWDDYFLGLEFGRPKSSNGGWSIWGFLNIYSMAGGRAVSDLQLYRAEKIYIAKLKDCTVAEFVFPLSADDSAGKINLKAMQFPAFADWMFFKVKFDSKTMTPWRMDLSAYPGNSNSSKERERWIAVKDQNINVTKDGAGFKPDSNGLAIFSKFQHENFGNLIVFDNSKYSRISSPKGADGGVIIQFTPNTDETEFTFALGYFSDKPAKDEAPKFLNEIQPKIFEFMGRINWEPKVDASEFNKLAEDTAKLIKDLGDNADARKHQDSLDKIKASFKQAEAINNLPVSIDATNELKKLQEQISKAGLAQLQ